MGCCRGPTGQPTARPSRPTSWAGDRCQFRGGMAENTESESRMPHRKLNYSRFGASHKMKWPQIESNSISGATFSRLGLVKYCALPIFSGQNENANFNLIHANLASQIPALAILHTDPVDGQGPNSELYGILITERCQVFSKTLGFYCSRNIQH